MKYIIVKYPVGDQYFYFSYNKDYRTLKVRDLLLVDTGQFTEVIETTEIVESLQKEKKYKNLQKGEGEILRKLNFEDRQRLAVNKKLARELLPQCEKMITRHGLSMKLLDADLSFDEKKLTFYFGAEGRIDFRQLVVDLIRAYKKVIRLQQVGTRDEAKIFGGFGPCGREICCSKFLRNMGSITIDMAREQNLSSGISKISGLCGKLMCCLSYELEEYQTLKKRLPEIGQKIKTKSGEGLVISQNILEQYVTVKLKDGKLEEIEI